MVKLNGVSKIILEHVNKNIKDYFIVTIVFIIGIIAGVLFINSFEEGQTQEIKNSINLIINDLKENSSINAWGLLKESILKNLLFGIFLWFIGLLMIGVPILYATIGFRGFCLGYAISSAIISLGAGKGFLFSITTIFLQNLIIIPALFAITVSGIKVYKAVRKENRKNNVKKEIYRHTFFSLFMLIFLIISSFVEVYISSNLLILIIKIL